MLMFWNPYLPFNNITVFINCQVHMIPQLIVIYDDIYRGEKTTEVAGLVLKTTVNLFTIE